MTRMLIVGPPGVGKGTQAERIAERCRIPAISTGDIFRANIRAESELGMRVKAIVDAGDYVPDELTNELVSGRLDEADADGGFLLDGYPRTTEQVHFLDALLARRGHALDVVLRLVADEDEIVRRLRKRSEEQGRTDDSEEAIRHRQEVYQRETGPILDAYRDQGLLVEVDGIGTVDEVSERVLAALDERGVLAPA
ncbi:MAG: adenylate kinase [Micrococcales bacterium]|nr:adenylate kinase [Micrococcales bacterium]